MMNREEQLLTYGQHLIGNETALDLARLQHIQFLRVKLRRLLKARVRDLREEIAAVNQALLLGLGILSGQVTNPEIVNRYKAYISAQVQLYGGPAAIMNLLETNAAPVVALYDRFNQARTAIATAVDKTAIQRIDIE